MTTEKRRSGEVIVRQGEIGHTFYLISQGKCACRRDDTQEVVSELSAGDSFGEGALMEESGERAVSVLSTSPCVLYALPQGVFREYIGSVSKDMHVTVLKRKMVRDRGRRFISLSKYLPPPTRRRDTLTRLTVETAPTRRNTRVGHRS